VKFEVKTNEDFNVKEKDQYSTHHEEQDFPHQEDQDNPHYNDIASFDIIIPQETLMTLILQETLNDDHFLFMYHSSRLHDNKTHFTYSKLRKHSRIDARHFFVIFFFTHKDHLPNLIF
jgi:hypothetical protein